MNSRFELIAETAFTHQGNLEYLQRQIDAAWKAGCDFVKFQILIDPENYFAAGHAQAEVLKPFLFSPLEWKQAFCNAKDKGLKLIVLPLTKVSAEFCCDNLGLIDAFEVHSVAFLSLDILELIKNTCKTIFLGIGGRYPGEVFDVLAVLKGKSVVLMHGFQSFPTDPRHLNLSKMKKWGEVIAAPFGYADHTSFDQPFVNLVKYSYLLGARYFEKHIILDIGDKRVDHESAITIEHFKDLRKELDQLIELLGDDSLNILNEKEHKYRSREMKIVAIDKISSGEVFGSNNISLRVTPSESDFGQGDLKELFGRVAKEDVLPGMPIKFHHVS
ncbi:MAG: hypothetical protein GQF41_0490 [Candidatus Rifleibacterium amylolyticum]|nr:MAG: hypothetical protein GQF41_0490 [Candidatus Rifleibacterium amylolyticum]